MKHFLAFLCLLGFFPRTHERPVSSSEFRLEGEYILGGLFNIHEVSSFVVHDRAEAFHCSSQPFLVTNYRMFQLMRFAVEQINNSTDLLPNVSLGYEIFDHCSMTQSFPEMFNFISTNDLIKPWGESQQNISNTPKVVGVIGPFSSTQALTVAPVFMLDLIPMVSYGATSSLLSEKVVYPSFLRTVNPNAHIIEVIIKIMQHFKWRWVAFLNSHNDFGIDGLDMFMRMITDTDICLAYTKGLKEDTNHSQIFEQIDKQRIKVIIVFAPKVYAEALIESAILLNVTGKVWIADDGWALNTKLRRLKGIENIGTVLGFSQAQVTMPGFSDFLYSLQRQNADQQKFCNQVCNCSRLTAEQVVDADPSFSFTVYSAVYAVAHALHNALQCKAGTCRDNITVYPHMIVAELKKSNFTLLNQRIQFDADGDPKFGSYSIVFWNRSGNAQEIGFYHFQQLFFINNSLIEWFTSGEVPTSLCSQECLVGYRREPYENYKCCFTCEICPNGTYINITEDPFNCVRCAETEWSPEGSTSCKLRLVEYNSFTDVSAIVIMLGTGVFVAVTLAMSILFAVNYNTPIVRSAGGPMCFLTLGCLGLGSLSVFFYFGKPTSSSCILRFLPFTFLYTVCMACFAVRAFQIVSIFKIGAKFPKIQSCWVKYNGQWLVITVICLIQVLLGIIGYSVGTPTPYNETVWYPERIILSCDFKMKANSTALVLLLSLCLLCFIFSYVGKDLPKNYNEAKAITFCLLLLIITWTVYLTEFMLYRGKFIIVFNAVAVLSSLCSFVMWYFLPKCYIIIFQPHKNTPQYFQGLIQNYTKTISQ